MKFKIRPKQITDFKLLFNLYFWALIFFGFSLAVQINYDAWRRWGMPKIKVEYNVYIEPQPISAAVAKSYNFGFREFLADWYWLTFIQYYGGGDPYGKYRKPV